jgi:hypothetical protein
MPDETTQTAPAGTNVPQINTDNLKTIYANICRIGQSPNELIIDFGLNPNFFGGTPVEPFRMECRILLSHDGAKRLALHLGNALQTYESTYGVIELDVTKRIKKN